MSETGLRGTAPKLAIGAAIVALLTSVAAVIVVTTRDRKAAPAVVELAASATERRVAAADVGKLKRDAVEKVSDGGRVIGVKVTDADLRTALGLAADDVITALGGRAIKRELDIYDAVLGMTTMDASIAYVELARGGKPVLVRWWLDGELRAVRRTQAPDPASIGVLSSAPGDPLLDTIHQIDPLHVELPRATLDRLVASSSTYARGARLVPAFKDGRNIGIRFYAIRPGSVWSALGLANGDTVRAVNGQSFTTADSGLEVYEQIKDAPEWRVEITRRGKAEVLTITFK